MKYYMVLVFIMFLVGNNGFAQEKLSLEECIQMALEYNATLKQKEYTNQSADYDVTGSYSGIMPVIDLSFRKGETTIGSSERIINDVVVDVDPITGQPIYGTAKIKTPKQYAKDNSLTLSVTQNLYDGGRWWNNINRAKLNKESSDYDLAGQRNETILTVQSLYYDLLAQMKLYEVNKVAVQRSEGQLTRTEKMYELGSKARLDVYQAKVNLGNDRISLLNQENIVGDSRRNLNLALGREPEEPIEIEFVEEVSPPVEPLNVLVDKAMESQPLLKRNEIDVNSSELGVSLSKAGYYPSLRAYFQYNRRNSDLEKIYSDLNLEYVWAVGLILNWNIFNGMSDYVGVQKSKIVEMSAREEQARYMRSLKSRIKAYHDNYASYVEIIAINEENLIAAQEELRLAEERYQIGAGTSLEVREAQVKLTRAEQTLIAARYNSLITQAQLDNELGLSEKKLSN